MKKWLVLYVVVIILFWLCISALIYKGIKGIEANGGIKPFIAQLWCGSKECLP